MDLPGINISLFEENNLFVQVVNDLCWCITRKVFGKCDKHTTLGSLDIDIDATVAILYPQKTGLHFVVLKRHGRNRLVCRANTQHSLVLGLGPQRNTLIGIDTQPWIAWSLILLDLDGEGRVVDHDIHWHKHQLLG